MNSHNPTPQVAPTILYTIATGIWPFRKNVAEWYIKINGMWYRRDGHRLPVHPDLFDRLEERYQQIVMRGFLCPTKTNMAVMPMPEATKK